MAHQHTGLRVVLVLLSGFVAVSALPSAFLVVPTMPLDWIRAGPFTDWTIPAIALGFVGVVAAAAVAALLWRPWSGALASIIAGLVMVAFELVEIGVVGWTLTNPELTGQFQAWLQLLYLVVGTAQMLGGALLWWRLRGTAPDFRLFGPA